MNSEHKKDLVSGFANLQEVAITERPAPRSAAPNGRGWPGPRFALLPRPVKLRFARVSAPSGAGLCPLWAAVP
jgi:hypothetical protein